MMNSEYYLNCNPNCSPTIPTRYSNYLDREKYLSEFSTNYDKEIARRNLGITDIIEQLNAKIDNKVIERGSIPWDLYPTEEGSGKILSSAAIYNTLLKYVLQADLDVQLQNIWDRIINKINETYNQVEEELNELNSDFTDKIDYEKNDFNNYKTTINQTVNSFTENINQELTSIQRDIEQFKNLINNQIGEHTQLINSKIQILENSFESLQTYVNNSYNRLYQDLYENLNNNLIDPTIKRVDKLEQLVKTFLKTSGGAIIDCEFGNSDDITVSQKTLTSAINKIWEKLENITGEVMQGVNMVVTPDYFISEDGCNVHIKANTVDTNGIFEHIAFYGNGALIAEASNVDYFEHDLHIDETTVIMCKAKIMGVEYTRQSVITHYNSFWLGAGNVYSDIMDVEYVIPITNGMRGAYDVHVEEGQKIIIIVGESLADGFLRADLNSVEIPFTESTVTVDGKNYKVFVSEPWVAGDYNIDING